MRALIARRIRGGLAAAALVLCVGNACGDALPGSLPSRREADTGAEGGAWVPSLLLFGLALAAGGYAVWRRSAGAQARAARRPGETPVMRLSSQALTPHASVHAVQWNGEEFLLACTPQQVTLLARRPNTSPKELPNAAS